MKITLSKNQWEQIGKKAGWIKMSMRDMQEMYVSFVDDWKFEDQKDAATCGKDGIDPKNIWIIGYNSSAVNDDQLSSEIWGRYEKGEYGAKSGNHINFYKQYFAACSISAANYSSNTKISSEELISMINATSEMNKLFEFIKQNQIAYNSERDIEKRDMEMMDDQSPSHSDAFGPDQETPQY